VDVDEKHILSEPEQRNRERYIEELEEAVEQAKLIWCRGPWEKHCYLVPNAWKPNWCAWCKWMNKYGKKYGKIIR